MGTSVATFVGRFVGAFVGSLCRAKNRQSASPKPHPSKPHPCNMPQAKTEVALQFSECCAAETALQHRLFCSAEVILTKSCAATSEKLHCNIEKAALQESGTFLPLSCGFQAPTFRHPRLGPAEATWGSRGRSRGPTRGSNLAFACSVRRLLKHSTIFPGVTLSL